MPARALLPAALAALFAGWCGTLAGVGWAESAVAQALPLLLLAAAGPAAADPLRLGRWGRWALVTLLLAAAASWAVSPVPRAGRVGLLLLPAYLLLPAIVERCWRDEGSGRRGLRALAAVVGGVAVWSLVDWLAGGSPRPAAPLGHHGLLAAWLVTLLPLSALPALERGRWRWVGWLGTGLALAAILLSRSLAAWVAVAVQGTALLLASRRTLGLRRLALGAAAAGIPLLLALPRLFRVLAGADPSASARAVYWRAGWEGLLARPLLGWGPGATPWTAARFLDPVPGVNPPGEAVGELHSLPVQLLYETGALGALAAAALAALFAVRRVAALRADREPFAAAGLLGLLGAGVCSLASAAVAVAALPLAAALAAGAALAGEPPPPRTPAGPSPRRLHWAPPLFAGFAFSLLFPLAVAHRHYDRAAAARALPELRSELLAAVRWDPSFPLYRARLAAHHERHPAARLAAAEQALAGARDAPAVAALWWQAAVLGTQVRASWAPAALARARALDPLQPLPRDAGWLEVGRETSAASSFSLYLFRRRPWPAPLARGTLPISAGSAEKPAGKGRYREAKARQGKVLQQFAHALVQAP